MELPDVAKAAVEKVGEVKDAVSEKISDVKPSKEVELKGGFKSEDERLDRVPQFDPRSKNFPIRTLVSETPKTKTWACPTWNDQGREGACVGFSWSHELAADPVRVKTDNAKALAIYKSAQTLDEWPGEDYSGTSVLAGAKAVQAMKSGDKALMPEYRWAFNVDDLVLAIGNHGPAVIGINWYRGMFKADAKGFIAPTGEIAGGHAILVRGVTIVWTAGADKDSVSGIDRDKSYFTLRNSWGKSWGINGDCYITVNNMASLLTAGGDACVPVRRIQDEATPAPEVEKVKPAPAPKTPPTPKAGGYFAQKFEQRYHENHRGVRRDLEFESKEAAQAAGLVPCRVCVQ